MNNGHAHDQRGFAIVATVLVLCIVIVIVAAATALRLAGQLGQGTETRHWNDARMLAESCMESALQSLREDDAYAGNETLVIGSDACAIRPVLTGAMTTIQTEATVNGHPYRIQVVIDDVATVNVVSWTHVTAF